MATHSRVPLSGDAEADALNDADPLALVIGMVLDQQIPLEKAFRGPLDLRERLGGSLTAQQIAEMDPGELEEIFAKPPALHRFPRSMARRVQDACKTIVDDFDGDAARVWTGAADGAELLRRVKSLPGFGDQKAKIFVALLAKRLDFRPDGWEKAAGSFGEAGSFYSVADIDGPEALAKVRAAKKMAKEAAKAAAAK